MYIVYVRDGKRNVGESYFSEGIRAFYKSFLYRADMFTTAARVCGKIQYPRPDIRPVHYT